MDPTETVGINGILMKNEYIFFEMDIGLKNIFMADKRVVEYSLLNYRFVTYNDP
jgi:hypothetical protein